MSRLPESNQRPTDYKSVALPAELKWRIELGYFTSFIQYFQYLKNYLVHITFPKRDCKCSILQDVCKFLEAKFQINAFIEALCCVTAGAKVRDWKINCNFFFNRA